jgi:thymidine phosphorylase
MTPAEIIRTKRDGHALGEAQIGAFVDGLVDRRWSEGQAAALAMAILLKGMSRAETVALTRAMTASGQVLDWSRAGLQGPIVDKHSTGGVGDKVSLMLAPIVAACGGVVPMVSGRGLGHTGGTLDKMQSLAGYDVAPSRAKLVRALREAGCAIVGASARVAPADRRLYAIRDVTATVESVPLITASILSKKLAAGLEALVLDVKCGNGAFCTTAEAAHELASSLVSVAREAGLATTALVTDMNQVLGTSAGNVLEMREAIDFLAGRGERDARLESVTLALAGEMLALCGLCADTSEGRARAQRSVAGGAAAEHFARMVAALGGPCDVLSPRFKGLARAPVVVDLLAARSGVVAAMDTRELGLVVIDLGGGRLRADDPVDHRVGLSDIRPIGARVAAGEPLLRVHAASREAAHRASARALGAIKVGARSLRNAPLLIERIPGG